MGRIRYVCLPNKYRYVMEDAELSFIQGINEKREEAFHELFKRFRNYLVVFALRRVRQLDEAEDIVQEAFISVWESGKKWNSYAGFKAFLYESVQNRCLNHLKHERVKQDYAEYVKKFGSDHDDDAEASVTQEEVYRKIYLVAKGLPEKCRQVFELALEGKKNGEIAERLGISELTVKAHKQNALRYFKERSNDLILLVMFLTDEAVN